MEANNGRYPANAVFDGGGAKGFGLIGALKRMEQTWDWQHVAGTSSGAVVAAFVAQGLSADETRERFNSVKLNEIRDKGFETLVEQLLRKIPFVGPGDWQMIPHIPSFIKDYGFYSGDAFMQMLDDKLDYRKPTFGDLRLGPPGPDADYKLHVVASDITSNELLWLPEDIQHFQDDQGRPMKPDDLEIAKALRMSMSIPIFFEPYRLTDMAGTVHYIVDGGILSNFPFKLFEDHLDKTSSRTKSKDIPTFGFYMYDDAEHREESSGKRRTPDPEGRPSPKDNDAEDNRYNKPNEIKDAEDFVKAIWNTMFSSLDKRYVRKEHWARTVGISNLDIGTTQFDLNDKQKADLWTRGHSAAEAFMAKWGDPQVGFETWKAEFRSNKIPGGS